MAPDRKSRIDGASFPPALRQLFLEFVTAAEAFIPRFTGGRQWRLNHFVDTILDEAIDPSAPEHWWETWLFFFNRTARETVDAESKAVLAAGVPLAAALRAHIGPYDTVSLREIRAETVQGICRLSDTLSEPRKFFVGENVYSLAEALFNPKAWYRAIYAGKAPVGFLMLTEDHKEKGEFYNTRFMLAEPFHWRGYGRPAVELMAAYARSKGGTKLWGHAGEGDGSPKAFWKQCGFAPTGEEEEGEIFMARDLVKHPPDYERASALASKPLPSVGDMKARIRELILNECLPGETPDKLVDDTPLRDVLDSMTELKLVTLIEGETSLRVDARELSGSLDNLNTVMAFVEARQAERL